MDTNPHEWLRRRGGSAHELRDQYTRRVQVDGELKAMEWLVTQRADRS